jgi:hypothetical protein
MITTPTGHTYPSRAPDPVGALPPATPPDSPRIDVIWLNGHAA